MSSSDEDVEENDNESAPVTGEEADAEEEASNEYESDHEEEYSEPDEPVNDDEEGSEDSKSVGAKEDTESQTADEEFRKDDDGDEEVDNADAQGDKEESDDEEDAAADQEEERGEEEEEEQEEEEEYDEEEETEDTEQAVLLSRAEKLAAFEREDYSDSESQGPNERDTNMAEDSDEEEDSEPSPVLLHAQNLEMGDSSAPLETSLKVIWDLVTTDYQARRDFVQEDGARIVHGVLAQNPPLQLLGLIADIAGICFTQWISGQHSRMSQMKYDPQDRSQEPYHNLLIGLFQSLKERHEQPDAVVPHLNAILCAVRAPCLATSFGERCSIAPFFWACDQLEGAALSLRILCHVMQAQAHGKTEGWLGVDADVQKLLCQILEMHGFSEDLMVLTFEVIVHCLGMRCHIEQEDATEVDESESVPQRMGQELGSMLLKAAWQLSDSPSLFVRPSVCHVLHSLIFDSDSGDLRVGVDADEEHDLQMVAALGHLAGQQFFQEKLLQPELSGTLQKLLQQTTQPLLAHAVVASVVSHLPQGPKETPTIMKSLITYLQGSTSDGALFALLALQRSISIQRQNGPLFHRLKGTSALASLLQFSQTNDTVPSDVLALCANLVVDLYVNVSVARAWLQSVDIVGILCASLTQNFQRLTATQAMLFVRALCILRDPDKRSDASACSKVVELIMVHGPPTFWMGRVSTGGRHHHPGPQLLRCCLHLVKTLPSLPTPAADGLPASISQRSPRATVSSPRQRVVFHAHRLHALLCALRHRCHQQIPLLARRRQVDSIQSQRDRRRRRHAEAERNVKMLLGSPNQSAMTDSNVQPDGWWSIVQMQLSLVLEMYGVTEAALVARGPSDRLCSQRLRPVLEYLTESAPAMPPLHTAAQLLAHIQKLEAETLAMTPSVRGPPPGTCTPSVGRPPRTSSPNTSAMETRPLSSVSMTESNSRTTASPVTKRNVSTRGGTSQTEWGNQGSIDYEELTMEVDNLGVEDWDVEQETSDGEPAGNEENQSQAQMQRSQMGVSPKTPGTAKSPVTVGRKQRTLSQLVLRAFQAEVQWEVLVRGEDKVDLSDIVAMDVHNAFQRLYKQLKPLVDSLDQEDTWTQLRIYAHQEAALDSKRAESIVTHDIFRMAMAPRHPRLRPRHWGLAVDWLNRLQEIAKQIKSVSVETSDDDDDSQDFLRNAQEALSQLQKEISVVRAIPPWPFDGLAAKLLEDIVQGTAQQVVAQIPGSETVTTILSSGGALEVLREAPHIWAGNTGLCIACCQALMNVANLRPPPNLVSPELYTTMFDLLPNPAAAPYAMGVLWKITSTSTFSMLVSANGIQRLLAYSKQKFVPGSLQSFALQLLILGDYHDASLASLLVSHEGIHTICDVLLEVPETLLVSLLDLLLALAAHENLHLDFLTAGSPVVMAVLLKRVAPVGAKIRALRLFGLLHGSSQDTSGAALQMFLRCDGHHATMDAMSSHRANPDLVQAACASLYIIAQEEEYRKELFNTGAVGAAMDAIKAANSSASSVLHALSLLTALFTGAEEEALQAQFVRPSGIKLLCTVMQRYFNDLALQAKCCHLLYQLASKCSRVITDKPKKPKIQGVALTMSLRKNIEMARAEGEPNVRRSDVREIMLAEGAVGYALTAMKALIGQPQSQLHCMELLRAVASLGSDAKEELTHPQRRNMVTVHITTAVAAFADNLELVTAALATLLELAEGSVQSQKDICLTPDCLSTLCSSVLQLHTAERVAESQLKTNDPPQIDVPNVATPQPRGAIVSGVRAVSADASSDADTGASEDDAQLDKASSIDESESNGKYSDDKYDSDATSHRMEDAHSDDGDKASEDAGKESTKEIVKEEEAVGPEMKEEEEVNAESKQSNTKEGEEEDEYSDDAEDNSGVDDGLDDDSDVDGDAPRKSQGSELGSRKLAVSQQQNRSTRLDASRSVQSHSAQSDSSSQSSGSTRSNHSNKSAHTTPSHIPAASQSFKTRAPLLKSETAEPSRPDTSVHTMAEQQGPPTRAKVRISTKRTSDLDSGEGLPRVARMFCHLLGLLGSAKGVTVPLAKYTTKCAVALLRRYPTEPVVIDGLLRLFATTAAEPQARRFLLVDANLTALIDACTSPIGAPALARLVEDSNEAAQAAWRAGAAQALASILKGASDDIGTIVHCCRALCCIASTSREACEDVFQTLGVEQPLQLLSLDGKGVEQCVAVVSQLIATLSSLLEAQAQFRHQGAFRALKQALIQLETKHAGSQWKQQVMASDAAKNAPKVRTWQQMIGFAFARLLDFRSPLPKEMDDGKAVAAVASTQALSSLSPSDAAVCKQAIAYLRQHATADPSVFATGALPGSTLAMGADLAKRRDQLEQLQQKITQIRRREAQRQQQQEAQQKQVPVPVIHDPPPPREHVLTPRVFWHCNEPPEFRKPPKVPPNPQKIQLSNITSTSAVLRWEKPKSTYKLLYAVRLSVDCGKTFTNAGEPFGARVFKLKGLAPKTLYYITIFSIPALDEGDEIPPHSLAKRQQKLIHFWTMPDRLPPSRFSDEPRTSMTKKLPPLRLMAVSAMADADTSD